MKDEDYLVHNINKIAEQLKFINWNLGKLTAHFLKDSDTLNKIVDAEKKDVKVLKE